MSPLREEWNEKIVPTAPAIAVTTLFPFWLLGGTP